MFSTARRARLSPVLLALLVALGAPAHVLAQPAPDAPLFRIFLRDGDPLVSYGEFARVADRVVFSVPLDRAGDTPVLHTVSIPESAVDWERTDEYAYAVRARQYAQTRGEEDFAILASRVTQALNDINLTADPKRRLAMAEEARRNLAAWPAANYGYRAREVAQLVAQLDETVAEMRVAAGDGQFALSLVATTVAAPPTVDLLPPPNADAALDAAFRAALMAEPSDRLPVLRALKETLSRVSTTPAASPLRPRVTLALDAEERTERSYQELTRGFLREADQRAGRGDARGLQDLIARALTADDRLGRRRPGEMAALLAALDLRLSEANRIRLAREAWALRVDVFKVYRAATAPPRERLQRLFDDLRAIRNRQGRNIRTLQRLEVHATMAIHELRVTTVPPELAGTHSMLLASLQLARQAASLRRDALSSNNTQLTWDASSAAAGALMFAERAEGELRSMINAR